MSCGQEPGHTPAETYPDREFGKLFASAKSSIQRQLLTKQQKEFRHAPCSGNDRGIFVRLLNRSGERGCVGFIRGIHSLEEAVGIAAVDAAFFDPRYAHVTAGEVPLLEIEITVIGRLARISEYGDFRLGRDTVLVRQSGKEAVIQAQIAGERHYSKEKYLEAICAKAGLDRDAYKRKDAAIFKADTAYRKMKYGEISTDK